MWNPPSLFRPDRRALLAGFGGLLLPGYATGAEGRGRVIHRDDFRNGLSQWIVESEQPGRFSAEGGVLDIDTPAGATLWFREPLTSPVAIEYEVAAISAGGANDEVSDINCFWMATDARAPGGDIREVSRSGAFADYDLLKTYYAGIGGNRNSSSRFRRYVGEIGVRPLLLEHDLSSKDDLIQPNRRYHIRIEAMGNAIALLRDGRPMFEMKDPAPYLRGHFGLRTTWSHLQVRNFRILQP